jgi:hypothetical protein
MISLEPPYGARDAGDMLARIEALPEQVSGALERMAAQPWRPPGGKPALLAAVRRFPPI